MRHALYRAWLLVGACALVGNPAHAGPPEFGDTPAISRDGAILLSWEPADEYVRFEVEHRAGAADAEVVYDGALPSAHFSGLRQGEHRFRLRAIDAADRRTPWSRPAHVRVEHHSMALVWPLFGLGALVFLCTLGMVVHQVRSPRSDPDPRGEP